MTATKATTLHERWCTKHVDHGPESGAGWCASLTETHGVDIEILSHVDALDGGVGLQIYATMETFLTPAEAGMVGAETIGKAVLAAGHGQFSATVTRNLAALIATRGSIDVDALEPLADLLGVPLERLISEDFDPTA